MNAGAYNRGYRDGALGEDPKDNFEQISSDRDAYRMGWVLGKKEYDAKQDPTVKADPAPLTPARALVEANIENIQSAREAILENLMSNPGFLATYGNEFVAEFKEIKVQSRETLDDLTKTRELTLTFEHEVVIRMAADEEARRSAETHIRQLIMQRNEALLLPDNEEEVERLTAVLKQHEEYLKSNGLRITETGDLESV